ncbi:MAG: tetratricopeptide repeat protein [Bacteroidia bacterium]
MLVLITSLSGFAQMSKVEQAYDQARRGILDSAKMNIDAACLHPESKDDSQTWSIRGLIYKEIYKKSELSAYNSPLRDEAVESFMKALKLDTSKQYQENIFGSLKYLGSRYYNDATRTMDSSGYQLAISNFEKYKKIYTLIDPKFNSTIKEIEFDLALSYRFQEIYEATNNKNQLDLAKVYLMKALDLDPNSFGANKNLGILYYNLGVNVIKKMDYDVPLEELSNYQDQSIKYFKQALPFMLKAHQISPNDKTGIEGLQGIYYQLNDFDKSNEYKKKLETLNKQ